MMAALRPRHCTLFGPPRPGINSHILTTSSGDVRLETERLYESHDKPNAESSRLHKDNSYSQGLHFEQQRSETVSSSGVSQLHELCLSQHTDCLEDDGYSSATPSSIKVELSSSCAGVNAEPLNKGSSAPLLSATRPDVELASQSSSQRFKNMKGPALSVLDGRDSHNQSPTHTCDFLKPVDLVKHVTFTVSTPPQLPNLSNSSIRLLPDFQPDDFENPYLRALLLPSLVRAKGVKLCSAAELGYSGRGRSNSAPPHEGYTHRRTTSMPLPGSTPYHWFGKDALEEENDDKHEPDIEQDSDKPAHSSFYVPLASVEASSAHVEDVLLDMGTFFSPSSSMPDLVTEDTYAGPPQAGLSRLFQARQQNQGSVSSPIRWSFPENSVFPAVPSNMDGTESEVMNEENDVLDSKYIDDGNPLIIESWTVDAESSNIEQVHTVFEEGEIEEPMADMSFSRRAMMDFDMYTPNLSRMAENHTDVEGAAAHELQSSYWSFSGMMAKHQTETELDGAHGLQSSHLSFPSYSNHEESIIDTYLAPSLDQQGLDSEEFRLDGDENQHEGPKDSYQAEGEDAHEYRSSELEGEDQFDDDHGVCGEEMLDQSDHPLFSNGNGSGSGNGATAAMGFCMSPGGRLQFLDESDPLSGMMHFSNHEGAEFEDPLDLQYDHEHTYEHGIEYHDDENYEYEGSFAGEHGSEDDDDDDDEEEYEYEVSFQDGHDSDYDEEDDGGAEIYSTWRAAGQETWEINEQAASIPDDERFEWLDAEGDDTDATAPGFRDAIYEDTNSHTSDDVKHDGDAAECAEADENDDNEYEARLGASLDFGKVERVVCSDDEKGDSDCNEDIINTGTENTAIPQETESQAQRSELNLKQLPSATAIVEIPDFRITVSVDPISGRTHTRFFYPGDDDYPEDDEEEGNELPCGASSTGISTDTIPSFFSAHNYPNASSSASANSTAIRAALRVAKKKRLVMLKKKYGSGCVKEYPVGRPFLFGCWRKSVQDRRDRCWWSRKREMGE